MAAALQRITKTPGIQGGNACIAGTRIQVWVLDAYRRWGTAIDEILEAHPSVTREDLLAAWEYADAHRAEIDEVFRLNQEA